MLTLREYRRRLLLPGALLLLAGYYAFVFLPLARRSEDLDGPLRKAWDKLAASLEQTNALTLDFQHITNQLVETRQALTRLEAARKQAAYRLVLPPLLRARLASPFELVEYQNERGKQMDDFARRARDQKMTLDPGVLNGLPEHTAETRDPALLWVALAQTSQLLDTALKCNLTAVHSLDVPVALTNPPSSDAADRWSEIPVQIEFTASAASAMTFLESLPLRSPELQARALPPAPLDKMPVFIDHLIIRKQSSDKLDEVRVWLRAVGYVFRE